MVGQEVHSARTASDSSDVKPITPVPRDFPSPFNYQGRVPKTSQPVDIDGMNLMLDTEMDVPAITAPSIAHDLDLVPVIESSVGNEENLPWGNDPATSSWAPLMVEVAARPLSSVNQQADFRPVLRAQLAIPIASGSAYR